MVTADDDSVGLLHAATTMVRNSAAATASSEEGIIFHMSFDISHLSLQELAKLSYFIFIESAALEGQMDYQDKHGLTTKSGLVNAAFCRLVLSCNDQ